MYYIQCTFTRKNGRLVAFFYVLLLYYFLFSFLPKRSAPRLCSVARRRLRARFGYSWSKSLRSIDRTGKQLHLLAITKLSSL